MYYKQSKHTTEENFQQLPKLSTIANLLVIFYLILYQQVNISQPYGVINLVSLL